MTTSPAPVVVASRFAPLLLTGCLLMAACGEERVTAAATGDAEPEFVPAAVEFFGSEAALESSSAKLIAASRAVPPTPNAPVYPSIRDQFPRIPADQVVIRRELPLTALAVANDGTIWFGDEIGVHRLDAATSTTTTLIEGEPCQQLQFDAEGSRLLVQTTTQIGWMAGTEWIPLTTPAPAGRVWWLGDGRLLFADEQIIGFFATDRIRVRVVPTNLDTATHATTTPDWQGRVEPVALVGTIPALDMTWGVRRQPWQLVPMPGSVQALSATGMAAAPIPPSQAADLFPHADQKRNLVWVRTWKHEARAGRAWALLQSSTGTETVPLSGRIVDRVALSAQGGHGALVLPASPEGWEIAAFNLTHVEQSAPERLKWRASEEALRIRLSTLADALSAILEVHGHRRVVPEDSPVIALNRAPSADAVGDLTARLRDELVDIYTKWPDEPAARRALIQRFCDDAREYLPEDPAVVAALAGLISESIGDGTWITDSESPALLSLDAEEVTGGDGLTYRVLLPYAAARRLLAREDNLPAIHAALGRDGGLPLYFAESLRDSTRQTIQARELERAVPRSEGIEMGRIRGMLKDSPPAVPMTAFIAYSMGTKMDDQLLKLMGAWRLAEISPRSPLAMRQLGTLLHETFSPAAAVPILTRAIELDPGDYTARFALGDALAALDRINEAREVLAQITARDEAGDYQAHVAARIAALDAAHLQEKKP